MTAAAEALSLLATLGAVPREGGAIPARSPVDGSIALRLADAGAEGARGAAARAAAAFPAWRDTPAPRRGELVRLLGEELRHAKAILARLVTLEAGKIRSEAEGEVQEMIDICDFAVGLSRQLHGLTIATERPEHRMMEQWHPLGPVGVITAFNFPVAVWAWNAAIALACGDPVVWKPSEKTPLTALATQAILARALARFGDAPEGLSEVVIGGAEAGAALAEDPRLPLVSATGSTRMGRAVACAVAARLGRSLLELGGNNAAIVRPSADPGLTLRAVAFAAMGTAGQRCTTLRRLFVHGGAWDGLVPALRGAFASAPVGDPREAGTLIGPLVDRAAFDAMQAALEEARASGARVQGGQRLPVGGFEDAFYVRPALVEVDAPLPAMARETFAPLLYVMRCDDPGEAIALNNAVPQGLAASIFTNDLREAERFLSASGADCGIANVNIGPSGAEIGGAFGGEKETGGGRESGSDAWKAYMRRATNSVNYGRRLPLAQGVRFELGA